MGHPATASVSASPGSDWATSAMPAPWATASTSCASTSARGLRVYFGREGRAVVILLCGGDKSSQERDIDRAVEYWRDYRSRSHD
jgi:hypothetical protein